mmetsp:Transcript_125545/g.242012  ORF Transcript_125545/g.242012 Transcript_125545/m.242012 type:complete len:95 (-) Transcript_125545:124-408(-)
MRQIEEKRTARGKFRCILQASLCRQMHRGSSSRTSLPMRGILSTADVAAGPKPSLSPSLAVPALPHRVLCMLLTIHVAHHGMGAGGDSPDDFQD